MAARVADTFVESGSNVSITAHTPTGPDAGASWAIGVSAGAVTVDAANDRAMDANSLNGNRVVISPGLDSSEMEVSADISFGAGTYLGPGVTARYPNGSTGAAPEYEGYYDRWGGQWYLADSVSFNALTEAYPGGTVTVKLSVRNGDVRLYANGMQKCALSSNRSNGNKYAGLMLLNFDGGGTGVIFADNFSAVALERHQTRRMIQAGGFF